jgi:hypothetical protein
MERQTVKRAPDSTPTCVPKIDQDTLLESGPDPSSVETSHGYLLRARVLKQKELDKKPAVLGIIFRRVSEKKGKRPTAHLEPDHRQ